MLLPGSILYFGRETMPVTAVLGGQWGDEGKGKIVDVLSRTADVVARFQGGANAGHTIQVGSKEIILHQLPSGILRKNTICILGNGMVIDPVELINELKRVGHDISTSEDRIHISLLAHVVTPLHKLLDAYSEKALGCKAIGTTHRGIGPCYADKVNRTGIQLRDLRNISALRDRIEDKCEKAFDSGKILSSERSGLGNDLEKFYRAARTILPLATDTSSLINTFIDEDKEILIEGAQGTLLDIDFGSYPYVTSSNTVAGNICTGLGFGPTKINAIIGIYKSYTTRVGAGPFPTELKSPAGDHLQQKGAEFGATTRRKRRCGWFDAVLGKFTAQINGFSSIAITKLDVLGGLEEVKICTAYQNGNYPDASLDEVHPEYITLPGWQADIDDIRSFRDLPKTTRAYVKTIEELLGTRIAYISTGKKRQQIIVCTS